MAARIVLSVAGLVVLAAPAWSMVPHRPPAGPVVRPHPGPVVVPHPVVPHAGPVVAPHPGPVVVPHYPGAPVLTHPSPTIHPPTVIRPSSPVYAPYVSHGIYVNARTGLYRPGYAYYYPWHAHWHHGYWHGWYAGPFFAGLTIGWLFPPPAVVYWNPYYVVPPAATVVVYNYAQPIPVPAAVSASPETPLPAPSETDQNAAAAAQSLEQGRAAFQAGDYAKAQAWADQAVRQAPGDAAGHEFRALALFARGQYTDAAAVIHATLAVGPGWDWDTLRGLYPDTATYTRQLRALEGFVREHSGDAGAQFLLAYHYLVIDARDAAAKMLRGVVKLQPKDQVAEHLLKMLEPKPGTERPAPGI